HAAKYPIASASYNAVQEPPQFLTGGEAVSMVRAASGGGKKRPVFLDFAGVESMGDDARENRTAPARPADDPALSVRLKRLGQRLGEVGARRPVQEAPPRSAADMSGFARGMRLST